MTDEREGSGRGDADEDHDRALRRRVVEQFSGAGDAAAAWRVLDRLLPTGEYLNLGYTPWYHPAVAGDSQARLARRLADGLADRVGDPRGVPLLDVGCGRGGPSRQFAARGFAVTGLDLVPHNVEKARATVGAGRFVVGDATSLPFADDAFAACVAVDALVYVPDGRAAFAEAARVLEPGGWLAVSDLLAAEDAAPGADEALAAFADAWDLAPLVPADASRDRLRAAGFTVETVEDVTAHSVGRFRRWTRLGLALADGPTSGPLRALLRRAGVDPSAAVRQARAAHRALPHLRHQIVYARRSGDAPGAR